MAKKMFDWLFRPMFLTRVFSALFPPTPIPEGPWRAGEELKPENNKSIWPSPEQERWIDRRQRLLRERKEALNILSFEDRERARRRRLGFWKESEDGPTVPKFHFPP